MSATTNSVVGQPHHPEVRLERRERVVGDLGLGRRDGGDQRRLADVGEPDEGDVGEELELEPQPALLADLALLGERRRPAPVRQEPGVAPAAPPAGGRPPPVAGLHEVGEHGRRRRGRARPCPRARARRCRRRTLRGASCRSRGCRCRRGGAGGRGRRAAMRRCGRRRARRRRRCRRHRRRARPCRRGPRGGTPPHRHRRRRPLTWRPHSSTKPDTNGRAYGAALVALGPNEGAKRRDDEIAIPPSPLPEVVRRRCRDAGCWCGGAVRTVTRRTDRRDPAGCYTRSAAVSDAPC